MADDSITQRAERDLVWGLIQALFCEVSFTGVKNTYYLVHNKVSVQVNPLSGELYLLVEPPDEEKCEIFKQKPTPPELKGLLGEYLVTGWTMEEYTIFRAIIEHVGRERWDDFLYSLPKEYLPVKSDDEYL